MDALFLLYVGAIPVVPLIGAGIFKRRKDTRRRNVCYGLFALHLLLSIGCAVVYLQQH